MVLRIVILGVVLSLTINSVSAHTLWVNTFESRTHKPAHVLCSVGWGHTIPLDDLPQQVALKSYTLYDPDLITSSLLVTLT
jgi:uncharacterized GH25 family protein